MINNQQTVKLFLVEGNPTGLRTLELFNWSGKGLVIPRDSTTIATAREDIKTQEVYMLIGESSDGDQDLYIGETENLSQRIREHNKDKSKEFWDTAICFFSKDQNLNKAHVKFLEEMLIKEAIEAHRVNLKNGTRAGSTKLSDSDEAEVLIFAENIKLILSAVGYTFLKKPRDYEESTGEDLYECSGPDAHGKGMMTSEGFVVFKGSLARRELAPSAIDKFLKRRPQLIEEGVLIEQDNESYIFTKDTVFSSPSNAVQNILGRNANGWTEWRRTSDGKTLDEVLRK